MHERKPALIFDFGGVLLDWNPHNLFLKDFHGNTDAVDAFLEEIDFYRWNLEQDRGRSFADGVRELSASFPHYAHLIKAYDDRWEESITGPIESTVAMLPALKESGFSLFGLTNWSAEKFELVADNFSFFGYFEKILVSGVVKLAKPDERIFQMMLGFIRRPASECVLIDDSLVNVRSAKEFGFCAIHYQSSEQLRGELISLGWDCNQ